MEQLLELIRKRQPPGILILDHNGRLLYTNKEVLTLIPDLAKTGSNGRQRTCIPEEILRLCRSRLQLPLMADPVTINHVGSDCSFMVAGAKQLFSLRAFAIGGHGRRKTAGRIMVLIEKVVEKHSCDFARIRKQFNLSARELDVVNHLYQGLSNRMIAEKLCISEYTVKDHLKNIMEKMQVESRNGIVAVLR